MSLCSLATWKKNCIHMHNAQQHIFFSTHKLCPLYLMRKRDVACKFTGRFLEMFTLTPFCVIKESFQDFENW